MKIIARQSASRKGNRRGRRRGAALVEFAVVAPLMFLMFFLFIEFDRYIFVRDAMEEAARSGARTAILKDATLDDVQANVAAILAVAGVDGYSVAVTPELSSSFQQGDMITVTVSVDYEDVSWLPSMRFLGDKSISVACSLPREA
jgi:Flp pilus assembly protein TadG